ncbi:hypothetical protein AbraIFM66950_008770 [Aspergillus brasiliensis]|nr:hypothetical protein AbraIFM66950_008770 [Aspergillus brasiliensis]
MQLWHSVLQLSLLASAAIPTAAASAWGFTDATVSVNTKGAGVGAGVKEVIPDNKALTKPIALGVADTLKVTLTAQEGRTGKHAHQVYLLLQDPETGLDISYPFNVKDNGKSRLDLTQKDLPIQFLTAPEPLEARFLIGSFGESIAYNGAAFQLAVARNPDEPVPTVEVSRYGKLPEIHHIFKSDAQSPPIVITLAFVAMVLATLPVLGGVWLFLGVNVNHLPTALKSAPIPHIVFLGSLLSIEGLFFLYYSSWTLFQLLPAVAVVGSVAFVSGSRALGEVQGRRLAGLRTSVLNPSSTPRSATSNPPDPMGASSSKPARSAAQAVSRRQYPKQPVSPPTSSPAQPPRASKLPRQQQQQQQPQPPRQPSRPPPTGPTYHSKEPPSTERSSAIDLDGRDPDFAAHLRSIGPVIPNPTFSNSSTFASQQPAPTVFPPASNPALLVFSARQRLTKAAEQELESMGRSGFQGREYLDALTIRQVLAMRDRQGLSAEEIERLLRLKSGVVGRLGGKGVVADIG